MNAKYREITAQLKQKNATLVAVSKTQPADAILEMYNAGQRDFGENRVQELRDKYEVLPKDICWHLIGHLQSNKVKYIAPWVHMIHSVDTPDLLEEIERQGAKCNRVITVLLQVFIASEETKFGMDDEELMDLFDSGWIQQLPHVQVAGLMGMATNTDDLVQVRNEFGHLRQLFDIIKRKYYATDPVFHHLSMGMSSDYLIALEEGATMVRIGSLIFGERTATK